MSNDAGQAHLDTYLAQVQRHLHGLPDAEVREVIAELRSHVLDKVDGAPTPDRVEAAIAALGAPRDVARLNLTERVAERLEANPSPLGVARAIVRLAGLSLYGFFAGLVSLTGYGVALSLMVTAAVKPFAPTHAGLWRTPDPDFGYSLALGLKVGGAPRGEELLGWWIIPIGLVGGLAVAWLTWRFGLFSVRLMRRSAQRRRA